MALEGQKTACEHKPQAGRSLTARSQALENTLAHAKAELMGTSAAPAAQHSHSSGGRPVPMSGSDVPVRSGRSCRFLWERANTNGGWLGICSSSSKSRRKRKSSSSSTTRTGSSPSSNSDRTAVCSCCCRIKHQDQEEGAEQKYARDHHQHPHQQCQFNLEIAGTWASASPAAQYFIIRADENKKVQS